MLKKAAILGFVLSILLIGLAYASAFLPGGTPVWAPWLMMLGLSGSMVAMMVLGAARNGSIGRLTFPFAFVFFVLVVGFGFALALPATDPADPELWFGLPPRAAVILYGIGLLPLLVMPLAYALTFEEQTLRPEDLERIRSYRRTLIERSAPMGEEPIEMAEVRQ